MEIFDFFHLASFIFLFFGNNISWSKSSFGLNIDSRKFINNASDINTQKRNEKPPTAFLKERKMQLQANLFFQNIILVDIVFFFLFLTVLHMTKNVFHISEYIGFTYFLFIFLFIIMLIQRWKNGVYFKNQVLIFLNILRKISTVKNQLPPQESSY